VIRQSGLKQYLAIKSAALRRPLGIFFVFYIILEHLVGVSAVCKRRAENAA